MIGKSTYAKYYKWNGEEYDKQYLQVMPQRNEFDIFVNPHVPAICHSIIGGMW